MGQGISDRPRNVERSEVQHHFYHDMEGSRSLSTTIVSALAEMRGVDIASLGISLYDHIDTDALDAIFSPKLDGTPRKGGQIECSLQGQSITIYSDGHIIITNRRNGHVGLTSEFSRDHPDGAPVS